LRPFLSIIARGKASQHRDKKKVLSEMNETQAQATPENGHQAKAGLFHFAMPQFLVGLILLLVSYPFIVELVHGEVIEDVLMMIILISAVLAVGGRSWVLSIILVIPALAGPWVDHYWHEVVPYWIIACARMLFVGFVIIQLLRFILRSTRVNTEVLCAGISGYLMLGIWWTAAYLTVSQMNPGSFSGVHLPANQPMGRFDALYFSFTSLTCLGCSTIMPMSNAARMLLMVESTTGVLYVAVLIARLVALYTHSVQRASGPPKA
jgi:Ion channel